MKNSKHGGRRSGSGRPPLPKGYKRSVVAPVKLNEQERLSLDLARSGLSIADFVVLCSCSEIRAMVKAAGWYSIPEFLEAVKNGKIKLPTRPDVLPGGEML